MSRDDEIVAEIEDDLILSGGGGVVYLEGVTDPAIFFALLGVPLPLFVVRGFVHKSVLVRGLPGKSGSGASAVRRRVSLATARGIAHVYGFVDGDGDRYDVLAQEFDAPFKGPLFRWKGYAIENVLVRSCWPGHWGHEPEWPRVFRKVAPYVALNRLGLQIRRALADVGLEDYKEPSRGLPLLRSREVIQKLQAQPHLLPKRGVVEAYRREIAEFNAATLDEKHARLNGKWLVEMLPPSGSRRSKEQCRAEWIDEATTRGGAPELCTLWARAICPSS